jgi:hypothetical protein
VRTVALLLVSASALGDATPPEASPAIDAVRVAEGAVVFDGYLAIAPVAPAWVAGGPEQGEGALGPVVTWPVARGRLPPAVRALGGRRFRVYTDEGTSCVARATGFLAAARLADRDAAEHGMLTSELAEWSEASRLLVARLELPARCRRAVWARAASLAPVDPAQPLTSGLERPFVRVSVHRAGRTAPLDLSVTAEESGHFGDGRGTTRVGFPGEAWQELAGTAIDWASAVDLDGDGTDELIYRATSGERGVLALRGGRWVPERSAEVARFCVDP